jgi:hypothetical protein
MRFESSTALRGKAQCVGIGQDAPFQERRDGLPDRLVRTFAARSWRVAHQAVSYPLNSATEPHFGQCQICSGLQDSCSLNSASVSLDEPHLWQLRLYPL